MANQIIVSVVTNAGEKLHLRALPIDLVRFERQHGRAVATLADGRLDDLLWLGWHVATRTRVTALGYDAWLESIAELGDADTPEEVPAPLDGPASTES